MRATIIVRKRLNDSIAHLICVDSLDEKTVRDAVEQLEQRYSATFYRIDTARFRWRGRRRLRLHDYRVPPRCCCDEP